MGSLNGKNIVLTGSSGFIGRTLLEKLLQEGASVLAIDILNSKEKPDFDATGNIRYRDGDILNVPKFVDEWPLSRKGFTLIHLAWNMKRTSTVSTQLEFVLKTTRMMENLVSHHLLQVIALGTSEEYGRLEGCLVETLVSPVSPYGCAKHSSLHFNKSILERASVPLIWLRPFTVFGSGQKGPMLIPYSIEMALNGGLAEFSTGLHERDFIPVTHVVEAIIMALKKKQPGTHVLNLGSGVPRTVRSVIEYIGNAFSAQSRFNLGARQTLYYEPDLQYADMSQFNLILGQLPEIDFEKSLDRTIKHAREHLVL